MGMFQVFVRNMNGAAIVPSEIVSLHKCFCVVFPGTALVLQKGLYFAEKMSQMCLVQTGGLLQVDLRCSWI